jgi:hypothetical protein
MSIVRVRCLRRYHPRKIYDNRLHQALVVPEPKAYNVVWSKNQATRE